MKERGYSRRFYTEFYDHTLASARIIVPLVVDLLHPGSVVDVGCGRGVFLSAFIEQGVEDVIGLDGDWVQRDMLLFPGESFIRADLNMPLPLERTFDLVVSLEVAEHLPPESAPAFVRSLARLGPAVLFSAAIPYQRGEHHLNEQWPDYWAELFEQNGFVAIDCVRRNVWSDERVLYWYAQNTLLFVRQEMVRGDEALVRELDRTSRSMLSVVHPTRYYPVAKAYDLLWGHIPLPVKRLAYRLLGRFFSGP